MSEQPADPTDQQAVSPPPPPPPPSYRRLTRSQWDAPVSGVCGGIAEYLRVDPTVIRVLAVIAMVLTFPLGPITYLVLWAVIPKK